jgi:hypothetical protein
MPTIPYPGGSGCGLKARTRATFQANPPIANKVTSAAVFQSAFRFHVSSPVFEIQMR